ncbi:hypothetical protein G7054_g2574 [Neopestalotiopsis clavispora]|nr:hypothetical protein G7054_g2574 [Neopestalotiopsis clavispora]
MAASVGTASAIIGLVNTAVSLAKEINRARKSVKGIPKTLDDISNQLETTEKTLQLVRETAELQTRNIEEYVQRIVQVLGALKAIFDQIEDVQRKSGMRQFIHAIKSGEDVEKDLVQTMTLLSSTREELIVRISLVHVGLSGNLNDGFRIASNVIVETNENVKRVLGTQLAIAQWLQAHSQERRGSDSGGLITLNEADVDALGLADNVAQTSGNVPSQSDRRSSAEGNTLEWRNSTTDDAPRTAVGNTGFDGPGVLANNRALVEDSKFGKGARFMVGNIGSAGSSDFHKNFWN